MRKPLKELSLTELHILRLELAERLDFSIEKLKNPFYENDWQYIESSRDFYLQAGTDVYREISGRLLGYEYPTIEKMVAEGKRFRLM